MCVLGRPPNYHLYLRGNPTGGGRGVTTPLNLQPSGNLICCAGICYFHRGFSSSGGSGWRRSGGTGRARSSGVGISEFLSHCRSASARPFGCFDGSAAADLPGLRPFRRGCSRLAQGAVVRSMLLLENRFHFLRTPVDARGPGRIAKYCLLLL